MSAVDKQMSRSAVVSAYEGVGNLEVMEEVVNYNRFLLDVVAANANGSRAVVDFGAGCGTFSTLMCNRRFSVTSIEPDNALRARLKQKELAVFKDIEELDDASAPYIFSLTSSNILKTMSQR
jgi:hypothetical protein